MKMDMIFIGGKEGSTAKHLTVKEYKDLQSQLEEKTEKSK